MIKPVKHINTEGEELKAKSCLSSNISFGVVTGKACFGLYLLSILDFHDKLHLCIERFSIEGLFAVKIKEGEEMVPKNGISGEI